VDQSLLSAGCFKVKGSTHIRATWRHLPLGDHTVLPVT